MSKLKDITDRFQEATLINSLQPDLKRDMQYLIRQAQKKEEYEMVINLIEEGYRGSELDLEAILDKYFYGGTSPVRDNV